MASSRFAQCPVCQCTLPPATWSVLLDNLVIRLDNAL